MQLIQMVQLLPQWVIMLCRCLVMNHHLLQLCWNRKKLKPAGYWPFRTNFGHHRSGDCAKENLLSVCSNLVKCYRRTLSAFPLADRGLCKIAAVNVPVSVAPVILFENYRFDFFFFFMFSEWASATAIKQKFNFWLFPSFYFFIFLFFFY